MGTHDELLQQLSQIAAQNKIKRDAEEARAKKYQGMEDADYMKARQEQIDAEQNPYAMSAQGASLGSAFGPWGTLIGGIAGGVYGNVKDAMSRHEHGAGWGESIVGSAKDTLAPWQNKDLMHHPMNTISRGAGALGTLGSAYNKMQSDNALAGKAPAQFGGGGPDINSQDSSVLSKSFGDPGSTGTDKFGRSLGNSPLETYLSATGSQAQSSPLANQGYTWDPKRGWVFQG